MTTMTDATGAGRNRVIRCAMLLFCVFLFFANILNAQSFYGSIVGTVTDASGAVVPGATVTLTDVGTAEKHTVKSDKAGDYQFVDLVPATYSVEVDETNFKRYIHTKIAVDVNTTVRVNAALQVGAVTETVEVSTAGIELQTDSSTVSNKVEAQQVAELPLNGRNIMQLLNITAGVIPGSAVEQGATLAQNNGTSTNPLSWGGGSGAYTINGGDNEEYLDGAPINVLQGSNIGLMPTADAVQEFNIDTSVGGADEGRATGGVINETTKSGTNTFHGTAYEYFRNADLNANNFFNKRAGVGTPKFNQNLYGFSLGFPVKKNKIFFFGSYEVNNSITAAPTSTNEPTNGNAFSGGLPGGGTDIYDGVFTRQIADPTGKCPSITGTAPTNAPGLVGIWHDPVAATWTLGQGCWDPTSTVLRTFWANTPNATVSGKNYVANLPAGDVAPEMNARMDFDISPRQRVFAHTAWWSPLDKPLLPYSNPNVPSGLPGGKPWGLGTAVGGMNSNLYIVGDTLTLSPKTVLDLRAEYLRFRYNQIPKVNNFDLTPLGTNWAAFNAYLPAGNHWLPAPNMNGNNSVHNLAPNGIGFNNFGAGGQGQIWDNYGLNGNLTHVFGKHSVRVGFEARLMDLEILASGFNAGSPTFGRQYSTFGCPNPTANGSICGDEWADFLLGDFQSVNFGGSFGGTEFNYYQAYFASDTWQASRNLTLNFGVRWELPGGLMEKKNSTLVLQPYATDPYTLAYGTETLVASPTSPSRSIFPIKHDLLDPRLGFAYRLGNKTVVRGGYGITTQAVDEDGGGNGAPGVAINSDQLAWNNPTGNPVNQTPTAFLTNPIPNLASVYVPALRRSRPDFLAVQAKAAATGGGTSPNGFWSNERLPYVQQYNFAVQRELGNSFQITASYVGAHSVELHTGGNIDQIPTSAYTVSGTGSSQTAVAATGPYAGMSLTALVPIGPNVPSVGTYCTPNGAFCNTNWKVGQTLQPYPNYKNFTIGNLAYGNQHYNALQVTSQWRVRGGGLIGGAYTWAKTINDTSGQQDYNNHRGDRSVAGVPMRLAITVNYPLPIGQGQRFLNGNNWGSRFISGWALNDITSFQHGGYLGISSNVSTLGTFGAGGQRANYTPGCAKTISGSAVSRLTQWFNTSCFTTPGAYSFGNETVNDPNLFGQGIHNWDLSLLKTTKIRERMNVQFRVETFNTFNRFQAGNPNTQAGNGSFGQITSQANNPRQVQLSLRLNY